MSQSRRSFLIMVGKTALGTFLMPWSSLGGEPEPDVSCSAVSHATRRELLTQPTWGPDRSIMVWMESGDEGDEPRVMMWRPETQEEVAEANRFYEAAHYRSWHSLRELLAQPRQPGDWIVRWMWIVNPHGYLVTHDQEQLREADSGILRDDVREAAKSSHGMALRTVVFMTRQWNLDEDGPMYFDAVRLEDEIARLKHPSSIFDSP